LLIHERAWLYAYETATVDRAQPWMKYLEREWTYKVIDGVEGEGKWTFEEGRHAMIGRFREGDTTGIEMVGWQPNTALCVVNGYGSKGDC
jgi:hypothetical protein